MKIISFLILFSAFLFAKIEIFATSAIKNSKKIILNNPVILYKGFIIQSKKAIIINKKIYLEKDVIAFYKNSLYSATKAEIITKNNIKIDNIFLIDKSSEIWIKAKNAYYKNNIFYLKRIYFSSCCVDNPDWYLYSTSGIYNKKTKYIRLYNIRLYVNNVPVFFFPFFFNSLNKERRSGLLRPYIGYSAREGILYSQPIYIVLGQRADDEITPTIRTFRGRGIYNTFRFVTSPYDFGVLKFGEFIDFDKYYKKYNLAYKKHYGVEFLYNRKRVFNKKDKLYINIKYANDVDYFYLNPYNYTFNTKFLIDKLITSKLNYINNFSKNYIFGIYSKYFIDTTKLTNKDTIQILPQINLHKFETKNIILNSFDFNYYNYFSKPSKYFKYTFNMPLAYSFKTLNDYLNVKLSENIDLINANYYNSNTSLQSFYQIYSSIKFFSSLTKYNKSLVHIINPSISFNFKQFSKLTRNNNLLNYTKINNSINLSLFQIFEKGDLYIDHTMNENLKMDFKAETPLENIINIKKNSFSFSDTNKFDFNLNRVVYNSANVSFPVSSFNFIISHIYNNYNTLSQSYTLRIEKNVTKYKKYYFEYNYDITNRYFKYFILGTKLNKKCWQYDFNIREDRIPVLKDNGISYNNNFMLTLNVNFYPIGGLSQTIQLK